MEEVVVLEKPFSKVHRKAEDIIRECDALSCHTTITTKIRLLCQASAIHRIREYLNGSIVEQKEGGFAVLETHIVETEQWWIGVIMSLGDSVEVLEPLHIRERIVRSAEKIVLLYSKL